MHFTRDGLLTFLPAHSQLSDVFASTVSKNPKPNFHSFSHTLSIVPLPWSAISLPCSFVVGNCFVALDGVLLFPQLMHSSSSPPVCWFVVMCVVTLVCCHVSLYKMSQSQFSMTHINLYNYAAFALTRNLHPGPLQDAIILQSL